MTDELAAIMDKPRHQRTFRRAANSRAWAIGKQQRNGFYVRRVVWGRLMARTEKREGEKIVPAVILIRIEK
jgi:hypothetical protein